MVKKKVNKTKLITEALAQTPEATPKQIAASLEKFGVTPTYVSNIKSAISAKANAEGGPPSPAGKSVGRPASTHDALDAAIKFVEQSGGLKAAKAAIDKIERIKSL